MFLLTISERALAGSCLSPGASGLAKSREAIDSGLWRVGER